MRVKTYWNLHKHLWSIVALEGDQKNRVVMYAHVVTLGDVEGRVGAAGRERVRREERKNVHAYLVGELAAFRKDPGRPQDRTVIGGEEAERITYNPYEHETFVYTADGKPFTTAPWATLVATDTPDGPRARVFVPKRKEN